MPLRTPDVKGLRIGVMEGFYNVPVQTAIRDAVRGAAKTLAGIGFEVEAFEMKGMERTPNLWWMFFGVLPAPFTQEIIAGRESEAHWTGTEFLERALKEPQPTAKQLVESLALRDQLRESMLKQMEETPVLLLPPCGTTAFHHRQRKYSTPQKEISQFEAMMPATPFNLLGMPALVVPFGLDEFGLPVGIQLVGRPWDEETLLEAGVFLENARGPMPAPPGLGYSISPVP